MTRRILVDPSLSSLKEGRILIDTSTDASDAEDNYKDISEAEDDLDFIPDDEETWRTVSGRVTFKSESSNIRSLWRLSAT